MKRENSQLWLIGGTQESKQLAAAIALAQLPCIITVTTEAAKLLYPNLPTMKVKVGRLVKDGLSEFLKTEKIAAILDASHPYAANISQMAIAAAAQYQIPYLRYERPQLAEDNFTTLDSFSTLLAGDYLLGQRVFLAIGYKFLPLFLPWQKRATLFARILPAIDSLSAALTAGFPPERLIALRPPIAAELEKALWQQWQISVVVTKASGTAGGEDIKRQVAAELGISLIAIARPSITYPHQTSDFSTALEFCHQHIV